MNKTINEKLSEGRQYRSMVLEVKDLEEKDYTVKGYATTFNEPYKLYEYDGLEVWEEVDRNAFNDCDMSDVIMQYDHEGRVFARLSNETLKLTIDDRGLLVEANLGGTEMGRELYEEIKGGYTTKMSFGFIVSEDKWDDYKSAKNAKKRTILNISKLFDVSAVSLPANDATSISAERTAQGAYEQFEAERIKAEQEAKAKADRLEELRRIYFKEESND